jgi:uncharacterized protein YifE (UPF0438 family)
MSNMAHIAKLRDQYTQVPYVFDMMIDQCEFNSKEQALVERYGHWFEAIWNGDVPLLTDKLKHFYAARDEGFSDRTAVEQIWYLYDKHRIPF